MGALNGRVYSALAGRTRSAAPTGSSGPLARCGRFAGCRHPRWRGGGLPAAVVDVNAPRCGPQKALGPDDQLAGPFPLRDSRGVGRAGTGGSSPDTCCVNGVARRWLCRCTVPHPEAWATMVVSSNRPTGVLVPRQRRRQPGPTVLHHSGQTHRRWRCGYRQRRCQRRSWRTPRRENGLPCILCLLGGGSAVARRACRGRRSETG